MSGWKNRKIFSSSSSHWSSGGGGSSTICSIIFLHNPVADYAAQTGPERLYRFYKHFCGFCIPVHNPSVYLTRAPVCFVSEHWRQQTDSVCEKLRSADT